MLKWYLIWWEKRSFLLWISFPKNILELSVCFNKVHQISNLIIFLDVHRKIESHQTNQVQISPKIFVPFPWKYCCNSKYFFQTEFDYHRYLHLNKKPRDTKIDWWVDLENSKKGSHPLKKLWWSNFKVSYQNQ